MNHVLNLEGYVVSARSARLRQVGLQCPACGAPLQVRGSSRSIKLHHAGGQCADAQLVGEAASRALAWLRAGELELPGRDGRLTRVPLESLAICRETNDGTLYGVARTRFTAFLVVLATDEQSQAEVLDTLARVTDCGILLAKQDRNPVWFRVSEDERVGDRGAKYEALKSLLGERWLQWAAKPSGRLTPEDVVSREAAVEDVHRVLAAADVRLAVRKALREQAKRDLDGSDSTELGDFGAAFVWLYAWTEHIAEAGEVELTRLCDNLGLAFPSLDPDALYTSLERFCELLSPPVFERTGWQSFQVVQ